MDSRSWYRSLEKPAWAPDESVFGQVWSVLYPVIFVVNAYILYMFLQGRISVWVALPFWLNLLFNLIYSPIQFGLRNNLLASIDIILILGTIIWAMIAIYPTNKWIVLAFAPYLVWVSIATVLQLSILVKN